MNVSAVIWATGFSADYSMLDDGWLDGDGHLRHRRGVTGTPGLYVLDLRWLHTRGSALLGWVHRDAQHLAVHIRAGLRIWYRHGARTGIQQQQKWHVCLTRVPTASGSSGAYARCRRDHCQSR